MEKKEAPKKDITIRLASIRRRRRNVFLARVGIILSIILFVILLFNGAFSPVFSYLHNGVNNIRLAVDRGNGFPSELHMPGILTSAYLGDGAVVVGENDMVFISPTAKQVRRIGNSYANPLIVSSDDRVLIYTRGANDYRIEGYYQNFHSDEIDEEIFLPALADSGSYELATTDPQFRSSVGIYNSTGNELFHYKLAEEMPVAMTFSSNSRYFAFASVYSENGVLKTNIYAFSVQSRELIGSILDVEGVCLDVEFQSADRLLTVFDNATYVYSLDDGETVAEYSYNNRQLLKYAVSNDGKDLALLLGEEQLPSSITLSVFNSSLDQKGETFIPFTVDNMQYSEYNLLVSSGSVLYHYDDDAMPIEDDRIVYDENIIDILENGYCIGGEQIYQIIN